VVHRDIKPDNLLLTDDDVLKIVDFGVSEMFEKQSEMLTAKSAGSPAFLPPELCVTRHGEISGKAADIWSMGVSLYCLRFGKIPFERSGVLELYDAIKNDDVCMDASHEPEFCDLIRNLLEKDPKKRITMDGIRVGSLFRFWPALY
jgi:calcium/calmodulin-dependent protein kinase kinase 2